MAMTTIAVEKKVKAALDELGRRGESYNDVIKNLLREVAFKRLDDRWNRILADEEFISAEEL